jgi:ATP-dependent DNA helicase RecG
MDMQEENQQFTAGLQAVYHATELLNAKGLSSRAIGKLTKELLPFLKNQLEETLSVSLVDKLNLHSRFQALVDVHQPKDVKSLVRAQKRLKFEEFFFLQLHLLKLKLTSNKKYMGYPFEDLGEGFNEFYNKHLPFELTGAQKRVLKEIRNDVRNHQQMNRLLQGDVGSGKTLVALLSMLMAVDNRYQACLMAPTEILARQHFTTISEYLKEQNIKVAILTGSTKTKERRILHEQLENGEINIDWYSCSY